jgi:hypothetical protein
VIVSDDNNYFAATGLDRVNLGACGAAGVIHGYERLKGCRIPARRRRCSRYAGVRFQHMDARDLKGLGDLQFSLIVFSQRH